VGKQRRRIVLAGRTEAGYTATVVLFGVMMTMLPGSLSHSRDVEFLRQVPETVPKAVVKRPSVKRAVEGPTPRKRGDAQNLKQPTQLRLWPLRGLRGDQVLLPQSVLCWPVDPCSQYIIDVADGIADGPQQLLPLLC